ncbi:DUF2239 family protein [Phenylobacterium deserti]|uniref:DUF2239 domain-containing protein n=1 Tax=Phenylobacterium deserti TaxID=1914756 RepID=A0A328AIC6_9CAUL|nr:DUF2239 family protein [Phenylobacterium deserti]RAK52598.1 DUF2239 domain-containing protein [Phenylobacterium deserti]
MSDTSDSFTVFVQHRRLAQGSARVAACAAAEALASGASHVLVFDDRTGRPIDLDLRGPTLAVPPVESAKAPRGRGRPKLGVVAREVTLLPRHWDWLSTQPGGASATLRRLVDQARLRSAEVDRSHQARDAAYRVMSALAGDLAGFEDATRALFASDLPSFQAAVASWPGDVRTYLSRWTSSGLSSDGSPSA